MNQNRKWKKGFTKTLVTVMITAVATGVLIFALAANYISRTDVNQKAQGNSNLPQPQQLAVQSTVPPATSGNTTGSATQVVKSAMPGVVGISVLRMDSKSIFDRKAAEKWGVGSGAILSPKGYIVTNNHVAGGKSKRIIVSLADGRNVDGVTVWSDPVLDLAVVKIDASGLASIPTGDASSLQVGEPAIAIGNPLGLQFQRTVTSGIISALNRTITIDTDTGTNYMEDLIQTDASINPGNSGGPLLNSRGEVVGINTVKVTTAEGMGFAIPINVAVPIVNQLVSGGEFIEPYLGVFAYDREVIPYINQNIKLDSGVYVTNVDQLGPAYKGGIKVGCVITQVDGKKIDTMIQLRTYIYSKKVGDTIQVTCLRDGKTEVLPVTLTAKEKDGLITR